MFHPALTRLLAVLALFLFVGQPTLAAEDTHEGTVVKAGDGKLTMTGKDGKEHSHDIGKDVKITLDEKPAKLSDLKAGFHVTVTVHEKKHVTAIAAHSSK